jgi:hypothetical protein
MKLHLPHRLALAAALCASALPGWASPNEVTIDTANTTGFVTLSYGAHTANAALSNGYEVDGYTFAGLAGQHLRLVLSTQTAGLDPVITLRDAHGAALASASCSGSNIYGQPVRCAAVLDTQLAGSGAYTLNVADAGTDEAGAYVLHLDQSPPVNNWVGFGYGTPSPNTLGHLGDSDYFAFFGNAGSGVRLSIGSTTAGLDPNVEVWDASGHTIKTGACSGSNIYGQPVQCAVLIDLDFSAGGVFKVGVNDAGWDETGNYVLGVTCLYGNCASGIPVPPVSGVPEAPAAWLMGAGIAGLLAWRRRPARRGPHRDSP